MFTNTEVLYCISNVNMRLHNDTSCFVTFCVPIKLCMENIPFSTLSLYNLVLVRKNKRAKIKNIDIFYHIGNDPYFIS